MDEKEGGRVDEWKDGWRMDGRMDGRMEDG